MTEGEENKYFVNKREEIITLLIDELCELKGDNNYFVTCELKGKKQVRGTSLFVRFRK